MALKDVGALIFAAVTCSATFAATPPPIRPLAQPTEVKIVSVPAAQPSEVKIISTPPASPAEVRIVAQPQDDSARQLVTVTWGLLIANAALCGVTVWSTKKQSLDLKRRDRNAMEREVNRGAQRNADVAKKLYQKAQDVPAQLSRLHKAAGKEIPKDLAEDVDHHLQARRNAVCTITDRCVEILSSDLINRETKSDEEIIALLWTVDSHELQLQEVRDEITRDLDRLTEEEEAFLRRQAEIQAFLNQGRR